MNVTEIKSAEMIIDAINKMVEKLQKKVDKEREKIKRASVIHKGIEYFTKDDILESYGVGEISEKNCDRLLEKLDKLMSGTLDKQYTENELLIIDLNKYKTNLLNDLAWDRKIKEKQAQTDARMKELIEQGYSYRESETIIGNEELMRFE